MGLFLFFSMHILEGHRHSRKHLSLSVFIFSWVSSALKETYILGCFYIFLSVIGTQGNLYPWVSLDFLDDIKNLTTDLFFWRFNPQGIDLWRPALKVVSLPLAAISWVLAANIDFLGGFRGFLEGFWPSRVFSFVVVISSLTICLWKSLPGLKYQSHSFSFEKPNICLPPYPKGIIPAVYI